MDEKSLHLLPQEIIADEILTRLPVKSLLRFKCVSRSWRSLIGSSKLFIKTHLQKSTNDQTYAHWRIIFNCLNSGLLRQCSMRSYLDEKGLDLLPIDDPIINHLMTGFCFVLGSCNGLLCITTKTHTGPWRYFLWNPATRISIELPKLDPETGKCGFGWDEGSDAYKVFVVSSEREDEQQKRIIGKVDSTKTDAWTTVNHGCLVCGTGKFACGKIHWIKKSGRYIEFFDLKSEVFGMIELPSVKPEVGVCLWLWERRGCLNVICDNNNNNDDDDDGGGDENNNNKKGKKTQKSVWVMKEYGVKESWAEVVKKEPWVEMIFQPGKRIGGGFFCTESLVSPEKKKKN